jgi:alpha-D-xyloside xylohydrolase
LPGIVLVKNGSVIPHIALAQSTEFMDWTEIELMVFDEESTNQETSFHLPGRKTIEIDLHFENKKWKVNSSTNQIKFIVKRFDE